MGLILGFSYCSIDLFVFMPVPHCFDYYSFVVQSEVRESDSSRSTLLSQDCFGSLGSLGFPNKTLKLFTITKVWKQSECLSTDEWIKKMWYIYTMERYSGIKKNDILPFAATQVNLQGLILSEKARESLIPYDITYM